MIMANQYKHFFYLNGKFLFFVKEKVMKEQHIIEYNHYEYVVKRVFEPTLINNECIVICEVEEVKYKWFANSDDGAFEDESSLTFFSKKECYESMRNAALEKMKWNTQYDEDFNDEEDASIGYKVSFSQNKIIHESYSGVYTYEIKQVS